VQPCSISGFPRSGTLFLLATKMHDFEVTLPHLLTGRTVIEGRSVHSTAVYQSLIIHPDDDQAALTSVTRIRRQDPGGFGGSAGARE
jgi:thymidylate kinase